MLLPSAKLKFTVVLIEVTFVCVLRAVRQEEISFAGD